MTLRQWASAVGMLAVLSPVGSAKADSYAYVGTGSDQFGTIDLNTGVVTVLGSTGQLLAGLADRKGTLYATAYETSTGTLYTVDPSNGALTAVGNSGEDIRDFGSTTTGLYAVAT